MDLKTTRWPFATFEQAEERDAIARFAGPYRWLSNFVGGVEMYGVAFGSVEAAYVAAKLAVPAAGSPLVAGWKKRLNAIAALDPAAAKKEGRRIQLRPDWETMRSDGLLVKEWVLLTLVRRKYAARADLAKRLLETGDRLILEGNTWGDRTWGVIETPGALVGANRMGAIAMAVREELGGAGVPDGVPAAMPRFAWRGL